MYKVLLVDDEYMITEGLKKLIPFEKWDMEVVYTAEDADQALAYVADYPVDIVITDVNMPGKTGLEMIDQMQSMLPHAAYIIMSGYQDFAYVKKALNLRVADYLLKPVNKVELGNILEKLSQEFSEDELKILKMDVDENPETARAFGIMSIPTLLFKKDGQVVKQVAGVHTAEQIKAIVAELS